MNPLYQPTRFWQKCIPEILEDFRLFGMENFHAHPSSARYYAPQAPHLLLQEHYERFVALDRPSPPDLANFSQSKVGRPFNPFEVEGRHLTLTALNYMRGLAFLKAHVDTRDIKTVIEIGGGYGVLGEILIKSGITYINVDLPPLADLSAFYLRSIFGEDLLGSRVLYPWQLPELCDKADLAVNFISFQEMEPAVVENYATHFKRLAPLVLLRNSDKGKEGVETATTREDYIKFFSPYTLLAADAERYGACYERCNSEVMLFSRCSTP